MSYHYIPDTERGIFHVRISYGYILVSLPPSLPIRIRCDTSSNL